MSGIYVHIPFCKQACTYCDFHFSTSNKLVDRVVSALTREAEMRKNETADTIRTIYFGGGTPGILTITQLEKVLCAIHRNYHIDPDAEITLETNPDDVSKEKAKGWAHLGINRLSIGIQSFFDEHLSWMNRAHTAAEAENCVKISKQIGIDNMTIDLIYGIPNMTMDDWKENLSKAVDLGVNHISAYCLTVETDTALGHRVKKGKEKPVDEEAAAIHFEYMVDFLASKGLRQYEVSNFAKPGFESKHNSAYWAGVPYIALGPSAHGFNGTSRYWNVANNPKYCSAIETGELPTTKETLSRKERFNEWVMTGLRTAKGIDLKRGQQEFDVDFKKIYSIEIERLISDGSAKLEGDQLTLTKKGMFLADGIASDFFILGHED
ncbi:radical SAM family heme chaperone HemW [Cryomorphaceae bacterium 1068]|nr:radical SAM family heme chaperone HemW [Cryomorphaceae bacterium 1068]